jgi:hypothetical protein
MDESMVLWCLGNPLILSFILSFNFSSMPVCVLPFLLIFPCTSSHLLYSFRHFFLLSMQKRGPAAWAITGWAHGEDAGLAALILEDR